ncbi:MAG: acyl-CoA dehydrogenase, partial [Burkholderiales bacterium]
YEGATGYLVGEEHKGMRTMFVMMNEARLGVGMQGLAQAEVAFQNAADFARERLQGRSITGAKSPDKPADPIIVHPDVRRMLMDMKAFTEGARAFTYWTALQADLHGVSPDAHVREKADDRMALLTPVIKAFLTDRGFKCASDALQLHGGTGYTLDQGVEQFVRDARIALIYEGTNGIQALDLVGRKLAANGGRAVFGFFSDLEEFVSENEANEKMKPYVEGVRSATAQLKEATMWLMQNGMSNFDNAGASSHDYLQLFGLTSFSLMWAKMAKAALAKEASGDRFYADKLATARYFFDRVLPDATSHLAKVKTGATPVMALPADAF